MIRGEKTETEAKEVKKKKRIPKPKEEKGRDRKARELKEELNGSIDRFPINDSGINGCGKDFVLCDGHDVLRENSEIGTFPNLEGS